MIKTSNIVKIFLGSSCNFNCKYCIQNKLENEVQCQPDYERIRNYLIKKKPTVAILWGGEPLLYWDNFVKTAKMVKEILPDCHLTTISNGSLLTQDKVDFINEYNIGYGISCDGRHTAKLRGRNVLEDEKIRSLFLQIKNPGILTVLTPLNIDIYKDVWGYFDELLGRWVNVNIDPVKNCTDLDVFRPTEEEYQKYKEMIATIGKNFLKSVEANDFNSREYIFFEPIIFMMKRRLDNPVETPYLYCGHGHNVITIDLQGNVYTCNNSGKIIGTIEHDLTANAKINSMIKWQGECKFCQFKTICNPATCHVLSDRERQEECKLIKPIYEEVLKCLEYLAANDIVSKLKPVECKVSRTGQFYSTDDV